MPLPPFERGCVSVVMCVVGRGAALGLIAPVIGRKGTRGAVPGAEIFTTTRLLSAPGGTESSAPVIPRFSDSLSTASAHHRRRHLAQHPARDGRGPRILVLLAHDLHPDRHGVHAH